MVYSFGGRNYESKEDLAYAFKEMLESTGAVINGELTRILDELVNLFITLHEAQEVTMKSIDDLRKMFSTLELLNSQVILFKTQLDLARGFIQSVKVANSEDVSVSDLALKAEQVLSVMTTGQSVGNRNFFAVATNRYMG